MGGGGAGLEHNSFLAQLSGIIYGAQRTNYMKFLTKVNCVQKQELHVLYYLAPRVVYRQELLIEHRLIVALKNVLNILLLESIDQGAGV